MKLLLKLSWRNIWRNKRRSILTLSAVAFATLVAVAMRGLQLGTYDVNIDRSANLFSGYMQIQKVGYQDDPSLNKNFKLDDNLKQVLKNENEILAYSPRVAGAGLISYKQNSQGAFIIGIDPKSEQKTTTFMDRTKSGKFFKEDDEFKVVVGTTLLKNLKAKIGDKVVVLAQGVDGSMGNLKFEICGTVKLGNPEMDQMGIFMSLADAQELMALYGRINSIAIKCSSLEVIDDVRENLIKNINNEKLAVLNWMEVSPELKEGIEMDNAGGIIMLGILIVIVAFGILNTVLMSVTERFREFGIELSIGMPHSKLVIIILLETIFIALTGVLIGNLLGYGINYYYFVNPIDFSGELSPIFEEYGWAPIMQSTTKISLFINTSLSILSISFLAGIYPAIKVFRLKPLKGIRYT